jgi:hypothetical protein
MSDHKLPPPASLPPGPSATAPVLLGLGITILAIVVRPEGLFKFVLGAIGSILTLLGLWRADHVLSWRLRTPVKLVVSAGCLALIVAISPPIRTPSSSVPVHAPPASAPTAARSPVPRASVVIVAPARCTGDIAATVDGLQKLLAIKHLSIVSVDYVGDHDTPHHTELRFLTADDEPLAREVSAFLTENGRLTTLRSCLDCALSKHVPPHQLELWLTCPTLAPASTTREHTVGGAARSLCTGLLTKERVWKGNYQWGCDKGRPGGDISLRLDTVGTDFAIVERYSALIPVQPSQVYTVSYWVKTDLEIQGAGVFGKIVLAEYGDGAREDDDITQKRIDPGFERGENVGGVSEWTHKSYAATTTPTTAFVRLRAIIGGPEGYSGARGHLWIAEESIKKP